MNKTSRLIQGLAVALLTALLCGSVPTLWAQQEQQEQEQEPIEPIPTEQRETQDAENTPTTASEETDFDNSPFDYQSSEKISEDLSVSFPVDI
jgi:hypothetical protein